MSACDSQSVRGLSGHTVNIISLIAVLLLRLPHAHLPNHVSVVAYCYCFTSWCNR